MNLKKTVATMMLATLTAITLFMVMTDTASAENVEKSGITYDGQLNKWTPEPPYHVRNGRHVTLRFININRLKYKIIIDGKSINHNTDKPDLFLMQETQKEGIEDEEHPTKDAGAKVEFKKSVDRAMAKVKEEKKKEAGIAKAMELLPGIKNNLNQIKKLIGQLQDILYKADNFTQLELKKNQLFLKFLAVQKYDTSKLQAKAISKCQKEFKNAEVAVKVINELLSPPNEAKISKAQYEKIFQFTKLVEEFKNNKYLEKMGELLEKFSPNVFSISKTFLNVDADEIQFKVEIKPIDEKKTEKFPHQFAEPVVVRVKGGWKIDFSTGMFFQFDSHDRAFKFDPLPGDDTMVILKSDTHNHTMTPVVGALMHVYPRQIGLLKFALSFGLGTGQAENLSYYLGLGLMLGNKRRFIITGGVTAVKYNDLLPEYRDILGKEMEKNDDLKPEDLVKPVYRLKAFIGLTYNLGQ